MSRDLRPPKEIFEGEEAQKKIDAGVMAVARIVGRTMGPKGQSVALRLSGIGEGKPVITKDGVFVANHIALEDDTEDLGAQMAIEASRKTNDAAGDGTTGTVVLLGAMLQEARNSVQKKANPILIQKGMELERDVVIDKLRAMSKDVSEEEDIFNVAMVSCQDREIAEKITRIMQEIGEYGTINVESMTGPATIDLKVQRGMHFDIGYVPSLTHITTASAAGQAARRGNANMFTWENDAVGVVIFDEPVRAWNDVAHIFDAIVGAERRKLLIIGDFADDASVSLQQQMLGGMFTATTISRSQFGGDTGRETLKDIALYCGATFMAPSEGTLPGRNAKIDVETLIGSCTAVASRDELSITNGKITEDEKKMRVQLIQDLIEKGGLGDHDKQLYRERLARFTAGIGTITIIAPTEVQQISLRTRIDDAVCAVRSANEEGIVIGGGVALLRIHQQLTEGANDSKEDSDIRTGREIVRKSLVEPVRKIAEMAGDEPGETLTALKAKGKASTIGFNYWTNEFEDFMETGIIDPTKVVRLCVENAVAVAGELLRVSTTIVDMPKENGVYLSPRERAQRAHAARAAGG